MPARTHAKTGLILCLILMAGTLLYAQVGVVDPTEEENDRSSGQFFGNPNEQDERKEREAEYQKYYESELPDNIESNQVLRRIFTPRVNDELFDTNLPGAQQKGQLSLRLSPKFGDFLGDDYVRFPIGVRYNPSRYFEVRSDVGTYFPNPFGSGDGVGLYMWMVGGKYSWINAWDSDVNVAIGFDAEMPISDPPIEITDGYARYEPYVSLSHQLKEHPHWLVYLNVAYEFVEQTPFRAEPVDPQPKDRIFLRPGFIYYPGGNFRYSFELEYRTNALDFRDAAGPRPLPSLVPPPGFRRENWYLAFTSVHEVIAYPSITWFPTKEIRDGIFIPGNWDVGLRLKLPIVEETGQDFGISIRFRWYYDYRKLIAQDLPNLFSPKDKR
ncbi:MAG: hypothetical protein AB3N64_11440 [Puniceicoccaceae bacterium]